VLRAARCAAHPLPTPLRGARAPAALRAPGERAEGAESEAIDEAKARLAGDPDGFVCEPFPISGGGRKLTAEVIEQGVKNTVTTGLKTLLKKAKLPTQGGVRYFPPSGVGVAAGLPRTSKGGYIDKFGNVWERGPSWTAGEAFEWDGKPLNHLNVSLKGIITHVS
jgi:hypothetical protein